MVTSIQPAGGTQRQLVRYDERGTGLSDREVEDFSVESFVDDLETVVDECGLHRFALLGISQGAPVSIAFAVRHPERVSRLVLYLRATITSASLTRRPGCVSSTRSVDSWERTNRSD